jgi:hypothetical protein
VVEPHKVTVEVLQLEDEIGGLRAEIASKVATKERILMEAIVGEAGSVPDSPGD